MDSKVTNWNVTLWSANFQHRQKQSWFFLHLGRVVVVFCFFKLIHDILLKPVYWCDKIILYATFISKLKKEIFLIGKKWPRNKASLFLTKLLPMQYLSLKIHIQSLTWHTTKWIQQARASTDSTLTIWTNTGVTEGMFACLNVKEWKERQDYAQRHYYVISQGSKWMSNYNTTDSVINYN